MTTIELREALQDQARTLTACRLAPNSRRQVTFARRRAEGYSAQVGVGEVLTWGPETAAMFAVWAVTHEPFDDARGRKVRPIAPVTVKGYLHWLDLYRIERDVTPMYTTPVQDVVETLIREYGKPAKKAKGISKKILRQVVSFIGDSDRDVSDRAYILLQWSLWGRRIEVAHLNIEDVRIGPEGAVVTLRGPKEARTSLVIVRVPRATDPDLCAVRALEEHLGRRGATTGPVFPSRTGAYRALSTFDAVLSRRLESAGIAAKGIYSTHSLRRGPINEALRQLWPISRARRRSRHESGVGFEKYVEWEALDFSE